MPSRYLHTRPSRGRGCHPGTLGVPMKRVREIVGEALWEEFGRWIDGQTQAYCDGCGQSFVYEHDLAAFMAGERRVYD